MCEDVEFVECTEIWLLVLLVNIDFDLRGQLNTTFNQQDLFMETFTNTLAVVLQISF